MFVMVHDLTLQGTIWPMVMKIMRAIKRELRAIGKCRAEQRKKRKTKKVEGRCMRLLIHITI